MALATYSDLKTAVADRIDRSDVASYTPDAITIAEARINRWLRQYDLVGATSLNLVSGTPGYDLPTDFQTVKYVKVSDGSLSYPIDAVPAASGQEFNVVGFPRYWGIDQGQLVVYPTPDAAYTAQITYYAKPDVLSDSNTTNWVLTNAPDVLLYASLREIADHIQDAGRVKWYEGLYQEAKESVILANEMAKWPSESLRMRVR